MHHGPSHKRAYTYVHRRLKGVFSRRGGGFKHEARTPPAITSDSVPESKLHKETTID
jgi:hypothetical protein